METLRLLSCVLNGDRLWEWKIDVKAVRNFVGSGQEACHSHCGRIHCVCRIWRLEGFMQEGTEHREAGPGKGMGWGCTLDLWVLPSDGRMGGSFPAMLRLGLQVPLWALVIVANLPLVPSVTCNSFLLSCLQGGISKAQMCTLWSGSASLRV